MLEALGATIVDADVIAKAVVKPGMPALEEIAARFGAEYLDADGALDRRKMGGLVFGDPEAKKALEAIIHPRVAAETAQRIQDAAAAGAPLIVYDVPLLYENGLEKNVGAVIVVNVSPERQKERIRGRDDLDEDEIAARIASQMPLADKVARADHVIDNDGTIDETKDQVAALYRALTGEAA